MTASKWSASAAYRHSMDIIGNDVWLTTYASSGIYGRIVRSTNFGESWTSTAATLVPGPTQAYTDPYAEHVRQECRLADPASIGEFNHSGTSLTRPPMVV